VEAASGYHAARAGCPGPMVAENAPGNRCRRSPAQCRQRASLACPCRPIPVLFARAGSVSTDATGLESGVMPMRHCRCSACTARSRAGAGSTGHGKGQGRQRGAPRERAGEAAGRARISRVPTMPPNATPAAVRTTVRCGDRARSNRRPRHPTP